MSVTVEESQRIAEVMSGLATPTRVQILSHLMDAPATVGELTDAISVSQAAVSNHLRILRHLGLVHGDRQGRNVVYRLTDNHVQSMLQDILEHTRHA